MSLLFHAGISDGICAIYESSNPDCYLNPYGNIPDIKFHSSFNYLFNVFTFTKEVVIPTQSDLHNGASTQVTELEIYVGSISDIYASGSFFIGAANGVSLGGTILLDSSNQLGYMSLCQLFTRHIGTSTEMYLFVKLFRGAQNSLVGLTLNIDVLFLNYSKGVSSTGDICEISETFVQFGNSKFNSNRRYIHRANTVTTTFHFDGTDLTNYLTGLIQSSIQGTIRVNNFPTNLGIGTQTGIPINIGI